MRFLITISMALRALRRNTMRSILTALGMIIGIAAVITLVSLGNGATSQIQAAIASLGDNLVLVTPGNQAQGGGVRSGFGGATTLTTADAEAIVDSFQNAAEASDNSVIAASPYVTGRAQILANGLNWQTSVYGVSPDYPNIRSWRVAEGVFFEDNDVLTASKVAVVGKTIVDNLFPDMDSKTVIGQSIRVFGQGVAGGTPFKIIGVMTSKGFNGNNDQDDVIYVPYSSHMKRISRRTFLSMIYVQAKNEEAVTKVKADVNDLLTQRHNGTIDFSVQDQADITAARNASGETMRILLICVAMVSLIVGGIGIMNIMLVSVTERTREIGIRLALGAHGSNVLIQFLIEAISLSSLGGLVGVALGIGASLGVGNYFGMPAEPSVPWMVIAFIVSAVIGVAAGFYPAYKAAQLDPIDALRYE